MRARFGSIDFRSLITLLVSGASSYAAWLSSIVFCAAHGMRPLMIAAALFFPVGVVHGVGVLLGGW